MEGVAAAAARAAAYKWSQPWHKTRRRKPHEPWAWTHTAEEAEAVVGVMELNAMAAGSNMLADDDDGFTFAEVLSLSVAGADGGRCVGPPMYPVFGRPRSPPSRRRRPRSEQERTTDASRLPLWRFLMVDQGPPPTLTPADDVDLDLDGEPAESTYLYCPLCPALPVAATASPARCRKSGSTGSSLLRWRQRSIRRSHSDGKERFVFLNAGSSSGSDHKGRGESTGHDDALSYYANGGSWGGGSGGRRKSFLPYKQDLVGIFANATVFRRSYHPF